MLAIVRSQGQCILYLSTILTGDSTLRQCPSISNQCSVYRGIEEWRRSIVASAWTYCVLYFWNGILLTQISSNSCLNVNTQSYITVAEDATAQKLKTPLYFTNSHAVGSETDDIFEWVRRLKSTVGGKFGWCSGSRSIWVTGCMPRVFVFADQTARENHWNSSCATKSWVSHFGVINWWPQHPGWHWLASLNFLQW